MRLRTRLITLTVAVGALLGATSVAAPYAQARVFYLYPNSFYPAYAEDPSGISVTFVNSDSVSHHIISYQLYGTEAWSLDITLAPWQSYRVPERFYCLYGSCGYSKTWLFREADRSRMIVGSGSSYCAGYCGRLVVHL
jgi:hypothetical protein